MNLPVICIPGMGPMVPMDGIDIPGIPGMPGIPGGDMMIKHVDKAAIL